MPINNPWVDAPSPSEEAPVSIQPQRLDVLDFLEAIRSNRRKTFILIAMMLALAGGFGYVLGWGWDLAFKGTLAAGLQTMVGKPDWAQILLTRSETGIMLAIALLAGMSVWVMITLWRADKMVLNMTDAQELPDEALPQLHNIVEEMAIAAGLPKPRIFVVPTEVPNAFATGLRQDKAIVGVTEGLLRQLNRREMQGVMAHEMAHIMNGDMRYATIMAVMTGVLVFIAELVLHSRHFLNFGGTASHNGQRRGGNAIVMLVMVVIFILTAILVPILARMIQMGISRQREYLADVTAVQLTRDPGGLVSALIKISENQQPSANIKSSLEPLYIVTPMKMWQNGNMAWFSTHPPLEKRIERLKALE